MIDAAVIFGNNKQLCQELKEKLCELGCSAQLILLTGNHLDGSISQVVNEAKGKRIILVFKNEELKQITEEFHHQGITQLFVFPWDTHHFGNEDASQCFIPVDNSKPRLDYLEIEVSECCNLNCRGCNEFTNLAQYNKHGDLDETKKDLEKLKDFFWGIGKIRLMGGEPLVNPEFTKFIKIARELFPDSDIRLLSNGLLIPKLKQSDITEIIKYNCSFDISNYPPTRKMMNAIKTKLGEAGISYNISLPNKYFFKSLLAEPAQSPNESFSNCLFTHCHALAGGFLSACSNQLYACRLNEAFDLSFPVNDKIDIYHTTLNGWQINEVFKQPHDFCRYCGRGLVPYKWKTCQPNKAKASDWLIEPTFINVKVLPIIQRTVKSPAKKLRHLIRRPKGIHQN